MRLSEAWLREYADPPVDGASLVQQLTMAGLEVASVEPAGPPCSGVVVGEVREVANHPQADRLKLCQVSIGTDAPLQIVCGAPNVAVGMRVPVALEGASLPGGLAISRSEIRGVVSRGMLCSAKELGLEDSEPGLLRLPEEASLGSDVRSVLALDDRILEVDLTPNRADCLSVQGIAREVAALNRIDLHPPAAALPGPAIQDRWPITVTAPKACPRYLGRIIKGIRRDVRTPLWMRERLRRCGIRSLDPVVDVTNYVLLELGQPLHAFDLAKLVGGIEVRFARDGEGLTLLNDASVALDESTLVIADSRQVLALAGVMGGRDSAVSADTRDLFLECAFFSPAVILGRARRYGLATESSHRFERGVDPELQHRALDRATELVLALVGGQAGPVLDVSHGPDIPAASPIVLRSERVGKLLGVSIAADSVADILTRLSMQVAPHPDGWEVVPPSFRFDIGLEVDLIEEIGRVYGYNNLPRQRPWMSTAMHSVSEQRLDPERVKDMLVDRGYQEAITYSFVEPGLQSRIEPRVGALALKNPISSDLAVMRTTLWCGLLEAALKNQFRQQPRVRLFEMGAKFCLSGSELHQPRCVAGLASGSAVPEQWGTTALPVDFFDIKADVEAILELSGRAETAHFRKGTHPALHPGQCAEIVLDGECLGWLGMLHPSLEQSLGFEQRVFLFELVVDRLRERRVPTFRTVSKYPQVRRDLAVVVDESVTAEEVIGCVRAVGSRLVRRVVLFDVYQGPGIEDHEKSVALGLILQDDDETLTDARVDRLMSDVIERLADELNARLRA
jgi:phenylalanyl-tRNA synthetase beta chain